MKESVTIQNSFPIESDSTSLQYHFPNYTDCVNKNHYWYSPFFKDTASNMHVNGYFCWDRRGILLETEHTDIPREAINLNTYMSMENWDYCRRMHLHIVYWYNVFDNTASIHKMEITIQISYFLRQIADVS